MYILKMYTGLKNKVIGEIFGLSLSAVNKAALRVSILRRKQKVTESESRRLSILISTTDLILSQHH